MPENKDFKNTLNLPKTDFPMKANLPTSEPVMLTFWQEQDIYGSMLEKNKGNSSYILHDGPPYANGRIHIGHALNKILKDIIVKYKAMKGHYAPYVPGWDCHGLPIELEVDKKLGAKKAEIQLADKRKMCRQYAEDFVIIQKEEFMRLGVFGSWDRPYLTMNYAYEADIAGELMAFLKKGYVYKGKKPVHWCPSCVTALAEAEVEYAEKESPSIFVRFKVKESDKERLGLKSYNAYFVIWTTTPWTLPANLALAVNSSLAYGAYEAEDGAVYVVAEELKERLKAHGVIMFKSGTPLRKYKGSELIGIKASHPFIDRHSAVLGADFVSVEEGTGIVHIAPGHGQDDYEAGLKAGLEIYAPVDKFGRFEQTGISEIDGQFVLKTNPIIIDMLKQKSALLLEDKITHSYPHCWRCKKPVIFRATEQWFISMEHNDLRGKALSEVEGVSWVPTWGKDRIRGMIENRPDWCISRQRSWGVPITAITCIDCKKIVTDDEAIKRIISLIKEHSADVWFKLSEAELLPEGYKCQCGGNRFEKETDILDVWFDSGVSQAAVLKPEYGLSWPADMYLEGSDQHRGWFQSSILTSTAIRGSSPFRTVLTHGFVVDGQSKKMSKSVGNVVSPQDVIKSTGAEILRLWVSAEDYTQDIRISKEIIARLTEAYRKIRNTAKFLLGNLDDFDGGDYSQSLIEIDRYAMSRLQGLIKSVTASYEGFAFHEVYHKIYNFCIVDMSSFYLDILKDRLYTYAPASKERRACQWVLNQILTDMTRLLAPVLSFTAEEIYKHAKGEKEKSVFLSGFPSIMPEFMDPELELRWGRLIAIRDAVNKALELKRRERVIGNSLEAKITIHAQSSDHKLLTGYLDFLPALFIVSQAEVIEGGQGQFKSDIEGMSVTVTTADGEKCQRCWQRSITVGTIPDSPEICKRCGDNLR